MAVLVTLLRTYTTDTLLYLWCVCLLLRRGPGLVSGRHQESETVFVAVPPPSAAGPQPLYLWNGQGMPPLLLWEGAFLWLLFLFASSRENSLSVVPSLIRLTSFPSLLKESPFSLDRLTTGPVSARLCPIRLRFCDIMKAWTSSASERWVRLKRSTQGH